EEGNAIAIGQMVKSTSGPLTPLEVSTVYTGPGYQTQSAGGGGARPAARGPMSSADLLAKIQSRNYEDKEFAAKRILKEGNTDPAVLDALEQEILEIYNLTPRDKNKCDSIAHMIKALGASVNPKYKPTIAKVANEAKNGTVERWAKKTLSAY
ncbi:MAG TPA: hypothetical protein VLA15_06415, partial [Desulfurivibrionaceae bacterium]|nr:hypothetical protein [Desulfurivibrionaceae bacterium]